MSADTPQHSTGEVRESRLCKALRDVRGPQTWRQGCRLKVAVCRECISLVKELGCPVEHIVLPTFAVEHKLFVGPFARKFPAAKVHVAPRCAPLNVLQLLHR